MMLIEAGGAVLSLRPLLLGAAGLGLAGGK